MEGEEIFFCCFYWFGRMWSFAYIPLKKKDQNHVVHLKNLFGGLGWF